MKHIIFEVNTSYKYAVLIKQTAFQKKNLKESYINPLVQKGVGEKEIIAFTLEYGDNNKTTAASRKKYLDVLLKALNSLQTEILIVADGDYFKTLTKMKKVEPYYGSVVDCVIEGFEHLKVMVIPNYQNFFYKPELKEKLNIALEALQTYNSTGVTTIGTNIIQFSDYPNTPAAIQKWLDKLLTYPSLAMDIETFGLKFWEAGIATIAFAWSQHEGIAFKVDEKDSPNTEIRSMLKAFFEAYTGKAIWQNANFDLKVLVYCLWMNSMLDEKGKQEGIEVMTRYFDDTKLITYLATNSTTGNNLRLKDQAQAFAGNYAQEDIKDVTLIPLPDLLEYNLVDALATNYVHEKHWDTMIKDNQEQIYNEILIPSVKVLLQVELTGMPINLDRVREIEVELQADTDKFLGEIQNDPWVLITRHILTKNAWVKDYEDRKNKAKNPDKIKKKPYREFVIEKRFLFNPNSNKHMQTLLFEVCKMPILDFTKTKQASVAGDTLEKLKNISRNDEHIKLLNLLGDYMDIAKILGTFIKAFKENSVVKEDGWAYLHGSFNLGGTVSGRLSSSQPNLQNLPSGSKYGKLIKSCFEAPPGKLLVGADFNALESRINALLTKDPNKLKIYIEGFDSHCINAAGYFFDQMPDIDPKDVKSVNSIKEKYPNLRHDSKPITFAAQYGGTFRTFMDCGFSEIQAKKIEERYHRLYIVSDEWVAEKVKLANKYGYVDTAFGLRIRTPVLKQVILGQRNTPFEAQNEGRTLGNAVSGQSYGLLNNRVGIEIQKDCLASKYRYDIQPIAHIHDATYYLIDDDLDTVSWFNKKLIKHMEWQDLPEIKHNQVGLGGELSIFYPTWAKEIVLPNNATDDEIRRACAST